ncbi:MAG TPA: hypothetical protein ENH82_17515 [bacterium]|nr:hypothetical protein [bacterium]
MRIQKITKLLQDALSELHKNPIYERLIDITEELFEDFDVKVVLVMSRTDFQAVREYLVCSYNEGEIIKNIQCPHGDIDYIILDDKVSEMYGYKK